MPLESGQVVLRPPKWHPQGLAEMAEHISRRYLLKSQELPKPRMLPRGARFHRPIELLGHVRYVCEVAKRLSDDGDEDRAWCTIEMAVGIMIGTFVERVDR